MEYSFLDGEIDNDFSNVLEDTSGDFYDKNFSYLMSKNKMVSKSEIDNKRMAIIHYFGGFEPGRFPIVYMIFEKIRDDLCEVKSFYRVEKYFLEDDRDEEIFRNFIAYSSGLFFGFACEEDLRLEIKKFPKICDLIFSDPQNFEDSDDKYFWVEDGFMILSKKKYKEKNFNIWRSNGIIVD